MSKTVTIIDTFGFFFRSFYALPPLTNAAGHPTGLLTGFTNFISTLHKDHSSDYIIFALDSKGPTFRNEIDPNYKANRASPPEELSMQLPIAIAWIEKMGFKSIAQVGYEADDMIASVANAALKKGYKVRVVSHDKDLYQLILDTRVVVVDAIKRKEMTEEGCYEKYGVTPAQFTDYQSILGDSADNVPGVKGIGKVGAEKLLKAYGSLENIYKHIDEIKPPGVQKKLREFEDDAWMSKKLVTLKNDLFEDFDFEAYAMRDENPFIGLYDELVEYEMNGVLRVLHAKKLVEPREVPAKSTPRDADNNIETQNASVLQMQRHLILDDKELIDVVNRLDTEDIVAFDTETTGLDTKNDTLVGFSFAMNSSEAYYVPLAHFYLGAPTQVSEATAKQALEKIFKSRVVGHNIKFDLHFVTRFLDVDNVPIYADTIVMAWLKNPESPLGLDKLSLSLFNHTMVAFKDTVKKGDNFSGVEVEDACKYAAEDALITFKLYEQLLDDIKQQDALHLLELAHKVEFPFVQTLLGMEKAGIKTDSEFLERFLQEVKTSIETLTQSIYEAAGSEFNINSTKQLGVVLFETLGMIPPKKTKTGYSTDEKVLNSLIDEHEIIPMLLQYRETYKLYSTYIQPLLELSRADAAQRIHTSYAQTGTATGRLSSKNPNLQNIPTRTALGVRIREAFVAGEGKKLIGIDYSQIELRLLAHFSKDPVLVQAFNEDKDIHLQTAIALFGEQEAASKRFIAKTVNFGLMYGMGPKKLSQTLGDITSKEAKVIIEKYFESFPTVKTYFRSIVDGAQERGYIETLLKRRRYFNFATAVPMMKAAYERESVNSVFQGSAADLIKMAMNKIAEVIQREKLNATMLLQIHDELIFEVNEDEADVLAARFVNEMENIFTLEIPLKVSVNIGNHWGALK